MKNWRFVLTALIAPALVFATSAWAQQEKVWIPAWQTTAGLSVARAGGAAVEVNGAIYSMGGIDGKHFLATTEFARIQTDGRLTPWQGSSRLNEPRGFFDATAHNGYLYAVGGGNGPAGHNLLASVERAAILADGTLGPWQLEKTTLNYPRRCVKVIVWNGRLYALGGFGGTLLDTVESAAILADGTLGPWRLEQNKLTLKRYVHAVKKTPETLVVLGGHNDQQGVGLNDVEWRPLNGRAHWQPGATLQSGRYALSAAYHGNYLYALGGLGSIDYLRSIEKTQLDSTTGAPSAWQTSNPLSTPRANFNVVVYRDWLYIIGGTNAEGYYNSVEYASFNQQGDLGYWGTKQQGHAYEQRETTQHKASVALAAPHQGRVMESQDAGSYSYIRVDTDQGEEWLAATRGVFNQGQLIRYSDGVMMTDFHSRTLNRRFASIRFVSRVEFVNKEE